MLISVDQFDASSMRFAALDDKPAREIIPNFCDEVLIANVLPEIAKGVILGTAENLIKRKQMLRIIKQEPVDVAFERAIGKNDSVYSNFVELIILAKQKVGRIAIKQGNRNIGFATGFMAAENLVLTNWHVFNTISEVADSEIQFFY